MQFFSLQKSANFIRNKFRKYFLLYFQLEFETTHLKMLNIQ
jgi:hypothetical protein